MKAFSFAPYLIGFLWLFSEIHFFTLEENEWTDKVNPTLLNTDSPGKRQDIIIYLDAQADLSMAYKFKTKEEKNRYVFQQLREFAHLHQSSIQHWLDQKNIPFYPFFIFNGMTAQANLAEIELIARRDDVAAILADPWLPLQKGDYDVSTVQSISFRESIEWALQHIDAPRVWSQGIKGQGVVIGGQDTGIEWHSPYLINQYRGWDGFSAQHDYNWHDAIHGLSPLHNDPNNDPANNPCGLNSIVPCDDDDHGTITMNMSVGYYPEEEVHLGVAPEAQWIGCRNMDRGWGRASTYIECFEWFLAPTTVYGENPRPDKSPHIINNSWRCPPQEECDTKNIQLMNLVVDRVKAAGILVVASAGNSGRSGCSSISEPPGRYESSFVVGATNNKDEIAGFSSRGPIIVDGSGRLKPNVVAPGAGVGAVGRNGRYFANVNGTSSSSPHVAGLAALLISANPELAGQVEKLETIIEKSAIPKFSDEMCGGLPQDETPNHVYGYGLVNAFTALQSATLATNTKNTINESVAEIYPNPFSAHLVVRQKGMPEPLKFSLLNGRGQLVHIYSINSAQEVIVMPKTLSTGMYFYQIHDQGGLMMSGKVFKSE